MPELPHSTTSFSLIDLAVNSTGGAFRLNGSPDSSVAGATFTQPITRIGNNHGSGDGFVGQIAEIDIYSGVLSSMQISNIEAQLTADYIVASTIVIGPATVAPTNNTYAGNAVTLSAPVIGGTATTTYQWQTDGGSGGVSFTNIIRATTTNYVLNTTGLLGTYEYQLIGTPFGGSSVTSAPVTLTVLAQSAPTVSVDTTANPSVATVGGNDTLSAAFVGNLPISYQWQVSPNWDGSGAANIAGATNTTWVLTKLQLTNSGYYYSLRASNWVSPNVANSSWLQLTVQPLMPLVQLIATNYNPVSGGWIDSSGNGNNAQYSGASTPTLVPLATPNGDSAVNIASGSGQSFLLTTPLDPSSGYTIFAYVEPSNTSGRHALTGGSASGALEYDIYNGSQDYLTEYTKDIGQGTATNISTSSFSLIDLAVNFSGGAFRLNGASDGSVAGATFSSDLTRIGNNEGGGDGYIGQIAEIDIYNGVLSSMQISNIEAQMTANYVTVSGIAIGPATVAPTNVYAGNAATLSAAVIGATGTTTFRWQTDNGSGGASFANISGATSTNYVLNTTGLVGTYEYQLIGTPFGGNSVTSAPVTLAVLAQSAPTVSVDTTASPSVATVAGNDTLSAAFVGNLPISYQWQVSPNANGSGAVNIAGATNTTWVLTNLQLTNSGYYYSLRASNGVSPNVANSSWLQLTVQPLMPLVQLIATNYNPVSGGWIDSSGNGNNAQYSGASIPALVPSVTPDGSSAVDITAGNGSFNLSSSLSGANGYTIFAYVMPTTDTGSSRFALTGGSAAYALEYNFYQGHQNWLSEYEGGGGAGTATIPTSSFSLVDLAVSASGGTFTGGSYRLNGASDGTTGAGAGSTTSPITRIGNNEGGGDGFVGDIAEIDIYSGVLSAAQINAVEAKLTADYGSAGNPAVVTGLHFTAGRLYREKPDHCSDEHRGGNSLFIDQHECGKSDQYLDASMDQCVERQRKFTTNLTGVVNPALKQQFYILSNTNN